MTEHDQLPLPDYDHLTVGSLTSRVRSLDADGVQTLLGYERAHGNRVQVVVALEHRLAALKAGAEPSSGDPAGPTPEAPPAEPAGSKVSEATTGPPVKPPSHGDPTNPAQPR
jgi:hypothetical protein